MLNGGWLIYDGYIRKFHILLKRPYVISTEASLRDAKWRNLLNKQISRLAFGSLEMTACNVFNSAKVS
jgi:hypothetical protein